MEEGREIDTLMWARSIDGCLAYMPQPRARPIILHVPWLEIEPINFWCAGYCSNQLSHWDRVLMAVVEHKSNHATSAKTFQCCSITWRHRSELFILSYRPSSGWLHGVCPCLVLPCHLIPLYSCSSLSVSQKPQGCPCFLFLVLVSSSALMFFICMFMRLSPSCQAGLRLNVTSSKMSFLISSLKQLLSCSLLHHSARFLHGTHYSLMLLSVYLV